MEVWKDIPGYEGYYQVSNIGNVRSMDRWIKDLNNDRKRKFKGRVLSQGISKTGYYSVSLLKNYKQKTFFIHQLVAITFLNYELKQNGLVVNHIDFNKKNNIVSNLEIVTHRYNVSKHNRKTSSKYTGVTYNKSRDNWFSRIVINGKQVNLGVFKDEYEAHLKYQEKLKEITNDR